MEHSYLSQEESANSPFVGCSIYNINSNVLDERRSIMDTKKIGAFIAMNRKKKGFFANESTYSMIHRVHSQ